MSTWFNWLWSTPEEERRHQSTLQAQVLAELRKTLEERKIRDHAERRYDYDVVLDLLTKGAEKLEGFYIRRGGWIHWRIEDEPLMRQAAEEWLDNVVRCKEFVEDHAILRRRIQERIRELQEEEGWRYDWHYFQLFRTPLPPPPESETTQE